MPIILGWNSLKGAHCLLHLCPQVVPGRPVRVKVTQGRPSSFYRARAALYLRSSSQHFVSGHQSISASVRNASLHNILHLCQIKWRINLLVHSLTFYCQSICDTSFRKKRKKTWHFICWFWVHFEYMLNMTDCQTCVHTFTFVSYIAYSWSDLWSFGKSSFMDISWPKCGTFDMAWQCKIRKTIDKELMKLVFLFFYALHLWDAYLFF